MEIVGFRLPGSHSQRPRQELAAGDGAGALGAAIQAHLAGGGLVLLATHERLAGDAPILDMVPFAEAAAGKEFPGEELAGEEMG